VPQTTSFITLHPNRMSMTEEEYEELFEKFLREFIQQRADLLDQMAERF